MEKVYNYQPEKLNLWDRIFNRYKTIPVEEGIEDWNKRYTDGAIKYKFRRFYIKYHRIDRLTGGYTLEKEYLT